MKRLLALVLISVSLSVGATLLATWLSLTLRGARHAHAESEPEMPVL